MAAHVVYEQEHEIFRESIRRFLNSEAVPFHAAWEEAGITPREFWRKAGAQGLLGPQVPEQYGGPGGDYRYLAIVNEEATRAGITGPNFAVHSDIAAGYLLKYGSEEQKLQWLPGMVDGSVIGAIAMTEPGAGSDLGAIRTTARRDGNEYVINGSKTFITLGQLADVVIVAVKTDPGQRAKGISLLLVETERTGFKRGRNLRKIGLKAQDTSELFFDDVRVPVANLLGSEGHGFAQLMSELPQERLAVAIVAMAASQRALDLSVEYAGQRQAFGQPLLDMQNTRFSLAGLKADIDAGWALVDQCIRAHMAGQLDAATAASAKLYTTELQGRAVDLGVQVHGGYGYMHEYPIATMYLDARVQRIYGGTSEIMKEIIARSIAGE